MDQRARWNGPAAQAWVEEQAMLDRLLQPMADALVRAVTTAGATQVLDVGCGTGGTTVDAARVIGTEGGCLGIDISEPMIAAARIRADREGVPAQFVAGDAQTYGFETAHFDMIISRFGVMFFDDPVAAFTNLRAAARDEAEMRLLVWRGMEENPFMTVAERAAAPLLPDLPPRRPNIPGQFAFADRDWVRAILEESGWGAVDFQPIDFACSLPERELIPYFTRLGPVGLAYGQSDSALQAKLIEAVRPAFDPFVHGSEVRFTAACWEIMARS